MKTEELQPTWLKYAKIKDQKRLLIDPNMYNKKGYLFYGVASENVNWWFDRIHDLLFIGKPPFRLVWLAYKFRKVVLFFYKKHNEIV